MILSNEEIRQALRSGQIAITPEPAADQYTTSAVDLFLGNQFRCWDEKLFKAPGARIDLNLAEQHFSETATAFLVDQKREVDGTVILAPHCFVLAITRERVHLRHGSKIAARVEGRRVSKGSLLSKWSITVRSSFAWFRTRRASAS